MRTHRLPLTEIGIYVLASRIRFAFVTRLLHENAQSSWDAFVELAGEWEGRQKIDGALEEASGGKWIYVAPGARYVAASGWSVGAALALPVWQEIRASHPDNRYRLMLALGRAF